MSKANLPHSHATAPIMIVLAIEDGDEDKPFNGDGVTWCQDRIHDADIPYMRCDQVDNISRLRFARGTTVGAAGILEAMASMLAPKSWNALKFRIMLAIAPVKAFNVLKKQVLDAEIEILKESFRPSNNPMP
jgi:hypothetical protein